MPATAVEVKTSMPLLRSRGDFVDGLSLAGLSTGLFLAICARYDIDGVRLLPYWLIVAGSVVAAADALRERLGGTPCGPIRTLRVVPGGGAVAVCVAATAALFTAPLVHVWSAGETHYSLIGGLLPYNDASKALTGGLHLLETGQLDVDSQRRPLTTVVFALYFRLFDNSQTAALLVQACMAGLASFLAAAAVFRSFGLGPAIVYLGILSAFAWEFIPTMLTEALGFTLGALAFTVLWTAIQPRRLVLFAAGLGLLTLALNARAGAFLILPALLLWGAATFSSSWKDLWRPLAVCLAGIAAGFVLNHAYLWGYGTGESMAHANFAHTFYGLASGGKTWTQAYADYPNIYDGRTETEVATLLYEQAWRKVLDNPADLLKGLTRGLEAYSGIFGFLAWSLAPASTPSLHTVWLCLERYLNVLLVVACAALVAGGFERRMTFLWAAAAAVYGSASVLFVDGGHRVFAATVPFAAAMAAAGLSFAGRLLSQPLPIVLGRRPASDRRASGDEAASIRPAVAAVTVAAVLVLAPHAAVALSHRADVAASGCPSPQRPIIVRMDQHNQIVVRPPGETARTFVPAVVIDALRTSRVLPKLEIGPVVARLRPGDIFGHAYDLNPAADRKEQYLWLVANERMLPRPARYVQFCGTVPDEPLYRAWRIFVAQSARPAILRSEH
jgi:hypothetical protein